MARPASPDEPDTILPVQFFDQTGLSDTPEKRLIFAVLLDAIVQLRQGDTPVAVDAERWIRDEIEDVPVTFSQACEALGIEALTFARGLLSWRAPTGAVLGAPACPLPSLQRHVTSSGRLMRRPGIRGPRQLAPSSGRRRHASADIAVGKDEKTN